MMWCRDGCVAVGGPVISEYIARLYGYLFPPFVGLDVGGGGCIKSL